MADSVIGERAVVNNSIVDEEAKVGKFCYIGLETSRTPTDRDVTVVGKTVAVPSYTAVCRGCRLPPDIGPEDLAQHILRPNAAVAVSQGAAEQRDIGSSHIDNRELARVGNAA